MNQSQFSQALELWRTYDQRVKDNSLDSATLYNEILASEARTERTARLRDSDWTQVPDVPLDNKEAWATYRQELRDVPNQSGFPREIDWPSQPES